jgi:hypothetical protein
MHNPIDQQIRDGVSRLRQLPGELTPPCSWQEFKRRCEPRARVTPRRERLEWSHALVGAVLLLCIGSLAIWSRVGIVDPTARDPLAIDLPKARPATQGGQSKGAERDQAAPDNGQEAIGDAGSADYVPFGVQAANARSRALESWLASLPREPAVVRVGTRAAVAGLEDRIAQVDDLLTSGRVAGTRPDRIEALQRERALLVGSLAQVRYAEVVASVSP